MSNDIDDLRSEVERLERVIEYLLAKGGERLCDSCNGRGETRMWDSDHRCGHCPNHPAVSWKGSGVVPLNHPRAWEVKP